MSQVRIKESTPAGVYDYLIGGNHYNAADKQVGDMLRQSLPWAPKGMRHGRWALFTFVDHFAQAGLRHYIDLATGFPSEDYPHAHLPDDAKIVYNDINPRVVEEARRMIGERANMRYVQSDARSIDTILAVAAELFGDERRVAISMVGLVYFLDDASLAQIFERLYDWSTPGSQLGVTTFIADDNDPNYRKLLAAYDRMGVRVYQRSPEEILRLAGPWQLWPAGMPRLEVLAEQHLGTKVAFDEESGQLGYGGILYRL
jgi:hypothetical protein